MKKDDVQGYGGLLVFAALICAGTFWPQPSAKAQVTPGYVGEVVHFVKANCTDNCHRAAIIVGFETDEPEEPKEATLTVLWSSYTDDPSGSGPQGHVATQRAYVPYDATGATPYSWHHLSDHP